MQIEPGSNPSAYPKAPPPPTPTATPIVDSGNPGGGSAIPPQPLPVTPVAAPVSAQTQHTDPATMPFLQPYLAIPDLKATLDQGMAAGWSQDQFLAAIMGTPWWQNTDEQARVFQTMPPGQRDDLIRSNYARIYNTVLDLYGRGYVQDHPELLGDSGIINMWATDVSSGKTPIDFLNVALKSDAQINEGSKTFKDQFAQVKNITNEWGLTPDATIKDGIKSGKSNDMILQDIRGSSEYAQRFPGQAQRAGQNLPRLTENAYLQLESGYQQSMRQYGVDPSQFDPTHMGDLIGHDVSTRELDERLSYLHTVSSTFGPSMRAAFEQHAGMKVSDADLYKMFHGMDPNLMVQYSQITGTDAISNADLKFALDRANNDEKAAFHHLTGTAAEVAAASGGPSSVTGSTKASF